MGAPHWPRTPRGVEPVRETCIYAHQNIFGQPLAHGVEQHLFHKKNGGLWEAIFSLIIFTKYSNNFSPLLQSIVIHQQKFLSDPKSAIIDDLRLDGCDSDRCLLKVDDVFA